MDSQNGGAMSLMDRSDTDRPTEIADLPRSVSKNDLKTPAASSNES